MPDILDKIQGEYLSKRLNEKNEITLTVRGHCMWPVMCDGDDVLIRKVTLAEIQPGDVVFYQVEGKFYCHRVMKKEGDILITRADRFFKNDHPILHADIFGKVVSKKGFTGRWTAMDSLGQKCFALLALFASRVINPVFFLGQKLKYVFTHRQQRTKAQTAIFYFLREEALPIDFELTELNWHLFWIKFFMKVSAP